MPSETLIEQLAIYQAQITIFTGLIGLISTLLSSKMRTIYCWPFRTFHKAFGNKAMEDKLDYLIQELTYDVDGTTIKQAVHAISKQMENVSAVIEERGVAIRGLTDSIIELQAAVEAKNNTTIAKFTAMLDQPNTPPLFETDASGEYIWVSASYISLTGRPLSEIVGWGWTNTIHPDDVEDVRTAWERSVSDERIFEHGFRFLSIQGDVTKVRCRATPIINAKEITGYIGVIEILPKKKHSSNAELLLIR